MATTHAKVVVVGEDAVTGRALEVMLQGAGYPARFLSDVTADEPGELLADFQLLVVAPDMSTDRRKSLLSIMRDLAMPTNIPILELLPVDREELIQGGGALLWPCSTEELKRAIDSALLAKE
jgi:hypothetical protein